MSSIPEEEWPGTVQEILGLYPGWVRDIKSEEAEIKELENHIETKGLCVTPESDWEFPTIPNLQVDPATCSMEDAKSAIMSVIRCFDAYEKRRCALWDSIKHKQGSSPCLGLKRVRLNACDSSVSDDTDRD